MKKNIGTKLGLYPMPVTVIGAMNDNKPTWTLVAHVGILGHDHILISLASAHFINGCIRKMKQLSLNLVNEEMLPQVDLAGSLSGKDGDKSSLFEYEMSEEGTPVINSSPLTMECKVEDIYPTEGFDNFVCTIENTFVDEKCLDEDGQIDYSVMKPVLFEMPSYKYLETGKVIGKCLSFKK